MDCNVFVDWLLDWKTTLFLASGCFGLAVAGFGLSFHRDFCALRQQTARTNELLEGIASALRK